MPFSVFYGSAKNKQVTQLHFTFWWFFVWTCFLVDEKLFTGKFVKIMKKCWRISSQFYNEKEKFRTVILACTVTVLDQIMLAPINAQFLIYLWVVQLKVTKFNALNNLLKNWPVCFWLRRQAKVPKSIMNLVTFSWTTQK